MSKEPSDLSFQMRLTLGSRSPRRRALLTEAGYRFAILPARDEVEENAKTSPEPREYVSQLSFVKAKDVVSRIRDNAQERERLSKEFEQQDVPWVVVSCDSVAVCDGEILGKPVDRADAERMLRKLSGSLHAVHTGLCVWLFSDPSSDRAQREVIKRRVETSILQMDVLSEERLRFYLDSGLWEGKAGAFGYQDGNDWLKLISGSASNVVGLPMEALLETLLTILG